MERLEDRLAPAAVSWTGNAGDNNWGTAGNWSNKAVPTGSDDVMINKSGVGTITIAGNSYSVRSLNDTTASLSIASGATLFLTAVAATSTFGQNVTVQSGGTLNVGAGATVQIVAPLLLSATLTDDGTLRFASGDTVTLNTFYGTAQIVVGNGGTLASKGTTFNSVDNNTAQLVFDAGSILGGTEVTGNIFNIPLFVPAIDVPLLTNNQSFQDVNINAGDSLAGGQSVTLTRMGTVSTANLLYVFAGNFTINAGATLAVGSNVPVQIVAPLLNRVTLTDDGTLRFASGDTVTLNTFYGTAQIVVGNGGTLASKGTTFNSVDNNTAQLVFDAGSILGGTEVTGNIFNIPLFVPAIDVPLLTNNQSFQDVNINAGDSLAGGQSVTFTQMGTVSTANLLYVFAGNFTINAGATLAVGSNVPVQIVAPLLLSAMLTDDGTLSFASGDTVTLNAFYGTTQIVVGKGGTLAANNTTFNAVNHPAQIVVNSGGALQLSDSSFALSSLWLNSGSTDTLQFVRFTSQININSGASINIFSNDFSNVGTNGIIATGNSSATINLTHNYWGTTDTTLIAALIEDHADDATRPTVLYQPDDPDRPVHTVATAASTTYSLAAQNVTLSASATSPSGTVIEGTVTFTVKKGSTTIGTPVQGTVSGATASATFTLPAGQAAGSYTIVVSYSDSGGLFEDGGDTSGILTVKQAPLTVTAVGINKIYDGTTTAYVMLSANNLGSDQVTASYTSASFANAGPGNGITVTVSGISISGAAAGNYNVQSTTTTTANIVQTTNPVYTYDSKGRPIGIVYPNGNVNERVYASDGSSTATLTNSTTGTVASGVTSEDFTYNTSGKLNQLVLNETNGNVLTDAYTNGVLSSASLTNPTTGTVASGVTSEDFSYNMSGKLTQEVLNDTNGNTLTLNYTNGVLSSGTLKDSKGNKLDDYTYNTSGKLITQVQYQSNGNVLTLNYTNGVVASATLTNPTTGTVANGVISEDFTYNTSGKLNQLVLNETNGNVLTYTYTNGILSSATLTNSSGTVASGVSSEDFTYNTSGKLSQLVLNETNGNVLTETYINGVLSSATLSDSSNKKLDDYTYDSSGKLINLVQYQSNGDKLDDYTYNAKGQLTAYDVYYSNGNVYSLTFTFDTNGNVTGSTATLTNPTTRTVSSGVASEDFTYDSSGLLIQEVVNYTNGNVLTITYAAGVLSSATLTNSSGTVASGVSSEDFTYNTSGKLTQLVLNETNGNVVTETYTNGVISSATLTNSSGTVAPGVTSEDFTYNTSGKLSQEVLNDTNGNVYTRTWDSDGDGTSYATLTNSSNTILEYYEYDAQGNLTYGPSPIKPTPWPPT